MSTLEFPVLFKVTVWVTALPTFTFPKVMLVALALRPMLEETPTPLKRTASVPPPTVTEMAPVLLPALSGSNFAVKVTDWWGVSTCGVCSPDMLNPLPSALADLISTLSEPSLVNLNVCDAGLPTLTFPKSTVEGVILNLLVDPVPLSLAVTGSGRRAIVTEILPPCSPDDLGLKIVVTFIVWPVLNTAVPGKPAMLNPTPFAETSVSVTAAEL
jgi:hypothetical protein